MKRHHIILAALTATFVAGAQDLHQEVEVEREISPVERDASRINLLPHINLPELAKISLPFSNRTVTATVAPSFSPLEPVASSAGLFTSDARGYLRLGLFPIYNAGLAAGYKIADTDRTRLNAWVNYTGHVYKRAITESAESHYWRNNTVTAAVDLHQAIGSRAMLDADVNYTYAKYNMWNGDVQSDLFNSYNQWVNRFDAYVRYRSSVQGLTYSIGAGFDRFSFGLKETDGASQNHFRLNLQGTTNISDISVLAIGVDADMLRSGIGSQHSTTGLITLKPNYTFTSSDKHFQARAGLRLDVSINDGSAFRIAPDVMAAWNPSSFFGFELSATGGTKLNTLASLYDVTPYCYPTICYTNSNIPLDFKAKAVIGPIHGLYLELNGGYARANDFAMPQYGFTRKGAGAMFGLVDLSAWHGGVRIGWDSRLLSVAAGYEASPSSFDKAYFINRDRAAHVVDARLTIRPLKALEIEAGYSLRACRAVYGYLSINLPGELTVFAPERYNIGNASDLSLSARYAISNKASVMISGHNLLNRNYLWLGDRPAQGITGMVGFELKF